MGDASRSDVCPYRQTKGVFPSVYGGTTGIRTLFSRHRTEIQLRNPLRNRGKSGVNRGGRVGRLRVKLHHFDPCRPPRKGFESLRFRQTYPAECHHSAGFFVLALAKDGSPMHRRDRLVRFARALAWVTLAQRKYPSRPAFLKTPACVQQASTMAAPDRRCGGARIQNGSVKNRLCERSFGLPMPRSLTRPRMPQRWCTTSGWALDCAVRPNGGCFSNGSISIKLISSVRFLARLQKGFLTHHCVIG